MSEARKPSGKAMSYLVMGAILLFVVILFSSATFLTIEPTERGVLFKRFGGGLDKENVYPPGFHIVAPWNSMKVFDVLQKEIKESMTVLSSNGLNIKVDVTIVMKPDAQKIGHLYDQYGPGDAYISTLVQPRIRSAVREVIGQFTPEELYSTKRGQVRDNIEAILLKEMSENNVVLEATLIRDIELPEQVQLAIEDKLKAEQAALKYEFILQQERQEAERKIIEANAKAEANRILNASLSNNILRDKGIEATLELAKSPNSKVVVVGGDGSDGLPLILGGGN